MNRMMLLVLLVLIFIICGFILLTSNFGCHKKQGKKVDYQVEGVELEYIPVNGMQIGDVKVLWADDELWVLNISRESSHELDVYVVHGQNEPQPLGDSHALSVREGKKISIPVGLSNKSCVEVCVDDGERMSLCREKEVAQ